MTSLVGRTKLRRMVLKAIVYWIVVAATRDGRRISTYEICDQVDEVMERIGRPPMDESRVRQNLIWLRNDGMVDDITGPINRSSSQRMWGATDPSWAGKDDPRWATLYLGTTPPRKRRPGYGAKRLTEYVDPHPINPLPAEVEEEHDSLGRSRVRTVFG